MSKHTHRHTSGPWVACDNNGYSIWRVMSPGYRASSASRTVAEVVGDSAETEANARLIAAAPEMYELLKSIDHALHLDTMNFDATDHRQVYDYAKNIRVLLAKIEGGEE